MAIGLGNSELDTASLGELITGVMGIYGADTAVLSENLVGVYALSFADMSSIRDAVASGLGKSEMENPTVSQSLVAVVVAPQSDSTTFTEAALIAIGLPLSEIAALQESMTWTQGRFETENATLTESLAALFGILQYESANLSESATSAYASGRSDGASIGEASLFNLGKILSDVTTLGEFAAIANLGANYSETATLKVVGATRQREVDTTTYSEIISHDFGIPRSDQALLASLVTFDFSHAPGAGTAIASSLKSIFPNSENPMLSDSVLYSIVKAEIPTSAPGGGGSGAPRPKFDPRGFESLITSLQTNLGESIRIRDIQVTEITTVNSSISGLEESIQAQGPWATCNSR